MAIGMRKRAGVNLALTRLVGASRPQLSAWMRGLQGVSSTALGLEAPTSVMAAYAGLLDKQAIVPDSSQNEAAQALQALQDTLLSRAASAPSHSQGPPDLSATLNGAYIYGPVGSGKTMLADMLCNTTRRALALLPPPAVQRPLSTWAVPGFVPAIATPSHTPKLAAASIHGGDHGGVVRQHFHEFMMMVHGRLHALQASRPRIVGRSRQGLMVYRYAELEEEPLVTVGREVSNGVRLLCLDELHVTDVADALILSRLFTEIASHGTLVAFTSNRKHADLYKGGLSYDYFRPFVDMIQESMLVLRVAGGQDYRQMAHSPADSTSGSTPADGESAGGVQAAMDVKAMVQFLTQGAAAPTPSASAAPKAAGAGSHRESGSGGPTRGAGLMLQGPGADDQLQAVWSKLGLPQPLQLPVGYGRTVCIPQTLTMADGHPAAAPPSAHSQGSASSHHHSHHGHHQHQHRAPEAAAFFTFRQLCGPQGLSQGVDAGGALAAPDFLAICRAFGTIFVQGVPQLGPKDRDEARRFVTLCDVAYDQGVRLVLSSAAAPSALFRPLLQAAFSQGINPVLGLAKASKAHQLEAFEASKAKKEAAAQGQAEAGGMSDATYPQGRLQYDPAAETGRVGSDDPEVRLSPEEVLMLHRAGSRLTEMTRGVEC